MPRSSSTPTPETSTADQRTTILEAALTVLTRDGGGDLTVRNVAAEAGCSTTGIYTWFGGKSGLAEAIFVTSFESFHDALRPAYEAGDLLDAAARFRRWAHAHPTRYLVMFGRAIPELEVGVEAAATSYAAFDGLVETVARHTGLDRSDAERLAYHVNATVHGYVMIELVGLAAAPDEELDDLYDEGIRRVVDALPRSDG